MTCPNGSRPKAGYSGFVWIDSQEGLDECTNVDKPWYCSFVGAVSSWGEEVETLCSGPPPPPDDYTFIKRDFGLADLATRISKFTAWARARAWSKYCECVPPENQGNCWRFSGQGVNNDAWYELFACGSNPEYQFNGTGYNPYINGQRLMDGGYQYRGGTQQINRVADATPTSGFYQFGSCSGCEGGEDIEFPTL